MIQALVFVAIVCGFASATVLFFTAVAWVYDDIREHLHHRRYARRPLYVPDEWVDEHYYDEWFRGHYGGLR